MTKNTCEMCSKFEIVILWWKNQSLIGFFKLFFLVCSDYLRSFFAQVASIKQAFRDTASDRLVWDSLRYENSNLAISFWTPENLFALILLMYVRIAALPALNKKLLY
jgi:hypothetical protein